MTVTKRTRSVDNKKVTSYQAEVYFAGERIASQTFPTSAAAYRWHDLEKARLKTGPIQSRFLDVVAKYKTQHVVTLSTGTLRSVTQRLLFVEDGPLASLRMDQINASAIDGWMDWLLQHPSKDLVWRKSFKGELIMLATLLKWWRECHDPSFVVPIVRRHRKRAVYKYLAPRRTDYYIRHEDIPPWLDWLRDSTPDPVYWRLAAFQILTATRVGEAAGLCWDCVDLHARTARICRTATWDDRNRGAEIVDRLKTQESHRIIRLAPELIDVLKEMGPKTSGPIFTYEDGRLVSYSMTRYYYNRGFKKLGLPWTATHICRHTWATLGLVANRGNLGAIQAALGHRTPEQTVRYAKVVAMFSENTADKVASMISGSRIDHVTTRSESLKPLIIKGK